MESKLFLTKKDSDGWMRVVGHEVIEDGSVIDRVLYDKPDPDIEPPSPFERKDAASTAPGWKRYRLREGVRHAIYPGTPVSMPPGVDGRCLYRDETYHMLEVPALGLFLDADELDDAILRGDGFIEAANCGKKYAVKGIDSHGVWTDTVWIYAAPFNGLFEPAESEPTDWEDLPGTADHDFYVGGMVWARKTMRDPEPRSEPKGRAITEILKGDVVQWSPSANACRAKPTVDPHSPECREAFRRGLHGEGDVVDWDDDACEMWKNVDHAAEHGPPGPRTFARALLELRDRLDNLDKWCAKAMEIWHHMPTHEDLDGAVKGYSRLLDRLDTLDRQFRAHDHGNRFREIEKRLDEIEE